MSFSDITRVLGELLSIGGICSQSYFDVSLNKAMLVNYFTEHAIEEVFIFHPDKEYSEKIRGAYNHLFKSLAGEQA